MTQDTKENIRIIVSMVIVLALALGVFWLGEMHNCKKFADAEGLSVVRGVTCRVQYKDKVLTRFELYGEKSKERDEQRVKEQKEWEQELFKHTLRSMRASFEFAYDFYKMTSDDFKADPLPVEGWKL